VLSTRPSAPATRFLQPEGGSITLTGTGTVQAAGTAFGVDNHKDVNVAFALDNLGRRLDQRSVPTTEVESRDLLRWAPRLAPEPGLRIEGHRQLRRRAHPALAVILAGW